MQTPSCAPAIDDEPSGAGTITSMWKTGHVTSGG